MLSFNPNPRCASLMPLQPKSCPSKKESYHRLLSIALIVIFTIGGLVLRRSFFGSTRNVQNPSNERRGSNDGFPPETGTKRNTFDFEGDEKVTGSLKGNPVSTSGTTGQDEKKVDVVSDQETTGTEEEKHGNGGDTGPEFADKMVQCNLAGSGLLENRQKAVLEENKGNSRKFHLEGSNRLAPKVSLFNTSQGSVRLRRSCSADGIHLLRKQQNRANGNPRPFDPREWEFLTHASAADAERSCNEIDLGDVSEDEKSEGSGACHKEGGRNIALTQLKKKGLDRKYDRDDVKPEADCSKVIQSGDAFPEDWKILRLFDLLVEKRNAYFASRPKKGASERAKKHSEWQWSDMQGFLKSMKDTGNIEDLRNILRKSKRALTPEYELVFSASDLHSVFVQLTSEHFNDMRRVVDRKVDEND